MILLGGIHITDLRLGTAADRVFLGTNEVWRRAATWVTYDSAQDVFLEDWMVCFAMLGLGGGNGGTGGGAFIGGYGGAPGQTASATFLRRGVEAGPLQVRPGVGGNGGGAGAKGSPGGASTVTLNGTVLLNAAGGNGEGNVTFSGQGAPSITAYGQTITGGAQVSANNDGSNPGGGGGGGFVFSSGKKGGNGRILVGYSSVPFA